MSNRSDEQLAQTALDDAGALAELYQRHVKRIYRYIFVRVNNFHDAEDLTAETFTEMLYGLGSYRGEGVFAAWLTVIARNLVVNNYRAHHPILPLDDAETFAGDESLDDAVNHHLQITQLRAALDAMPTEYAEVVRLRFFAELSTEETAQIMKRSPAAIKMLLHRAMRILRKHMNVSEFHEVRI